MYEVFRLLQSVPADTFPRNVVKEPCHVERMQALTSLAERRYQYVRHENVTLRRSGKSAMRTSDEGLPLLEVLHLVRQHSASDPHDKIYAALAFAAANYVSAIGIDYRKRLSDLLQDVAMACFRNDTHPLRFLGYAGLLGTGHMPSSWIPDWL